MTGERKVGFWGRLVCLLGLHEINIKSRKPNPNFYQRTIDYYVSIGFTTIRGPVLSEAPIPYNVLINPLTAARIRVYTDGKIKKQDEKSGDYYPIENPIT